jgi:hypothetical protein
MSKDLRELGCVKPVQLQPYGLIIEAPSGRFYDTSRRLAADWLRITHKGIETTTSAGDHLLFIHHIDHPVKAYEDEDMICIGFTSHYDVMRDRFEERLIDGIAGQNIIIEYEKEVWSYDLGQQIAIKPQTRGARCCWMWLALRHRAGNLVSSPLAASMSGCQPRS